MSSDSLKKALVFVLVLDMMLFLGQISINSVAASMDKDPPFFFNYKNSTIAGTGDVGNFTVDYTNLEGRIYETETLRSDTTGDWFSDTVKDIKNWFINNIPGLGYVIAIVAAPGIYLNVIGAPIEVSFALGGLWLILTIFLIVAFITGRSQ